MMRGRRTLSFVLGGFVLGLGARGLIADVPGNPYQGIVERNVFNLKPPPPVGPPEPPPAPVPKITLTGITTILGNKRALMKVLEPPKPPQAAKEESYILTEGQRDGEIEVLAIDEQAGTVKVNNHGTVQELTFDKDGAKLPGSPLSAAVPPGMPGSIAKPQYPHTGPNMVPQAPPPNPASRTIHTRPLRLPSLPGASAAPTGQGSSGPPVLNRVQPARP